MVLLSSFYFDFFSIPFFNPSDEACTGRSMLSQTAILLHHMCLTHGMVGRRGVCRERSQERGEGRKMKSRMGKESGHRRSRVMFRLSESGCQALTVPVKGVVGRNIAALTQVNKRARYSHKGSQVSPQNGGGLRAAWPLPAHQDVVLTR